jgi:hypothetical protein
MMIFYFVLALLSFMIIVCFFVLCNNVSNIQSLVSRKSNYGYWQQEFDKQQFMKNEELTLAAYKEMIWIDMTKKGITPGSNKIAEYAELKEKYISLERLGGTWDDTYIVNVKQT